MYSSASENLLGRQEPSHTIWNQESLRPWPPHLSWLLHKHRRSTALVSLSLLRGWWFGIHEFTDQSLTACRLHMKVRFWLSYPHLIKTADLWNGFLSKRETLLTSLQKQALDLFLWWHASQETRQCSVWPQYVRASKPNPTWRIESHGGIISISLTSWNLSPPLLSGTIQSLIKWERL